MNREISIGAERIILPGGPPLITEGLSLLHIYVVEQGRFRIKMNNPTSPTDPPITCCDVGEGSIFGWEVLMEAARERTPCARFTALMVPGQQQCRITQYDHTEYRALLTATHPTPSLQEFIIAREAWLARVILRRDELASKGSSGTRRISMLAPPRSPSQPGMKIPVAATLPDYGDDLPDTNPEQQTG